MRDFVLSLWGATADRGLFVPSREIIVAHGGLESGWGTARAYKAGWNAWNLRRPEGEAGPTIDAPDRDGQGRPIIQPFALLPSLDEAVTYYLAWLSRPKKRSGGLKTRSAYEAMLQGDHVQFVILLRQGGFFEARLSDYMSGMASALATVRGVLAKAQGVA